MTGPPFAAIPGGVKLAVRLTPRADRNEIAGMATGSDGRPHLSIRLTAPPVDGAANDALIAFLAEVLGVRRAAITLQSGHAARLKILHIAGNDAVLLARLNSFIA